MIAMEAGTVRVQLDRILSSRAFAGAERSSRFLRFVTEQLLEGRTGEIKESVIAIETFGRDPSFDSKSDPVVRVEARRLRDRLSAYYATEGVEDPVLITLPKGGYVPDVAERPRVEHHAQTRRRHVALFAGWVLFAVTAGVLTLLYSRNNRRLPTDTLQVSILPPESTSFDSFAISPDGQKLAFTAAVNGTTMLWVRRLDSLHPKVLDGTDGASYPFWSPDSESIGLYSNSKLKIIDMNGGTARTLANIVVGRGGAWSAAGQILFCPRPLGVLYRVPAAGGTPTTATTLDAARGEIAHGLPQFLPDGRHFLFVAGSTRRGESSIRVGSLDSTTSTVLLDGDVGTVAYAPVLTGHSASLLFIHGGALMAQPFDPRRLKVSGEPALLVPEVRHRRWQQISFSVSNNGTLIYQGGSASDRQLTWLDRNANSLGLVGPRNDYAGLSLSPDERRVAVWNDDDPATVIPTIWLIDLGHDGAVSRFTETGAGEPEFLPVWSPSSGELLFTRGDDRRMRLLVRPLSGGPERTLLDTDGPKFPTAWSSDGRFVAFGSQWPDYRYMHSWTMQLSQSGEPDSPRPFLRHSYEEFGGSFSPAARGNAPRWIAYTSSETGRYEVYVRDFPGGDQKWQVSPHGGWQPHWRGDGRELFYVALDGTLVAAPITLGSSFQSGIPPLFATGLEVTPMQIVINQYAVSRDGQRFLLNRRVSETTPGALTAIVAR
jgi:eukaryotic-like serine/threonine-protein kinase